MCYLIAQLDKLLPSSDSVILLRARKCSNASCVRKVDLTSALSIGSVHIVNIWHYHNLPIVSWEWTKRHISFLNILSQDSASSRSRSLSVCLKVMAYMRSLTFAISVQTTILMIPSIVVFYRIEKLFVHLLFKNVKDVNQFCKSWAQQRTFCFPRNPFRGWARSIKQLVKYSNKISINLVYWLRLKIISEIFYHKIIYSHMFLKGLGEVGYPSTGLSTPPPRILILTVPRRYFCRGSLLLLVLVDRIYTLVQLLC